MNAALLGLFAETPIHPGCGRSMGVVDLPVAREAATDYPVLVGSSLKGALRDKAETLRDKAETSDHPEVERRFGRPDQAGDLLVSDARLLLLPVRSLTGSYRWITCPHIIERFRRDLARAGLSPQPPLKILVAQGNALTAGSGSLFLEERQFSIKGPPPPELLKAIDPLLLHDDSRARLEAQIAVLHDDDFAWFVRYGLPIQARNDLEDDTKKSQHLWYEETLPPDTLMAALVIGRQADALQTLHQLFPASDAYLQAGGNETVGHGWFAVQVLRALRGDGGAR